MNAPATPTAPTATGLYRAALERLAREGVRFCLLRDRPRHDGTLRDLDLLIHPADIGRAVPALRSLGFVVASTHRQARFKLSLVCPAADVPARLDVHLRPVQDGLVYLDGEKLLSRVGRNDGWPVPCREDQLIHLLVHNLVGKRRIQAKHLPLIREIAGPGLDRSLLAMTAGDFGIAPAVLAALDDLDRLASDPAACRRARRRIMRPLLLRNWTAWPGLLARRIALWLEPLGLRRRGSLVVLIGPDGTGKTTLGMELAARLGALFHEEVPIRYMGPWSHHELPIARAICRSPEDDRGLADLRQDLRHVSAARRDTDGGRPPLRLRLRVLGRLLRDTPHEKLTPLEDAARRSMSDRSYLYTLLKYVWHHARNLTDFAVLSIELWWRYLLLYARLRRGSHAIADRWPWDLLSGSTRNVTGRRRLLGALFCAIYPRPDACYLLWNDAATLARRKTDLDRPRAELMLSFYQSLERRFPIRRLETTRPPGELADAIVAEVLPGMMRKLYGPWTGGRSGW